MAIKRKSISWNGNLIDKLEKEVKASEKNGGGMSFAALTHAYVIAGMEVARIAEKKGALASSPKEVQIWIDSISTMLGTRDDNAEKRANSTWLARVANSDQEQGKWILNELAGKKSKAAPKVKAVGDSSGKSKIAPKAQPSSELEEKPIEKA